ncbi:MAG: hypothetical protein ACRDL6_06685 [Solirubrobacterales bacterium]
MEVASHQESTALARRGRGARLLGAVLFGAWSAYLAATGQFAPAGVSGAVAILMGASYAARVGDPNVRRGSFLIAGTLFFCAYLLAIVVLAGGACMNQPSCEAEDVKTNIGLIALTVTTAGAATGEAFLAFRPDPIRATWTHRFVIAAFAVVGLFFISIRVTA